MSVLTPEEVAGLECMWDTWYVDIPRDKRSEGPWSLSHREVTSQDVADTLAAYADIVERVAEDRPHINVTDGQDSYITVCRYCGAADNMLVPDSYPYQWELDHTPDCLHVVARKLRGKE